MYTVSQLAKRAQTTPSTVRNWARDYSDYLSDLANPPAGVERTFTEEDAAVILTIATLRAQRRERATIIEALGRGDRIEPMDPPPPASSKPGDKSSELQVMQSAFTQTLQAYQGQVDTLQKKIDDLNTQLRESEIGRIEAETKLAAAIADHEQGKRSSGLWAWLRGERR